MTFVLLITSFLTVSLVSELDSQLKQLYYIPSILGFLHWILKKQPVQSSSISQKHLAVPHKPLLDSLSSLDLSPLLLSWLHSDLQGHIQQIILNGFLSSKCQVTSGVSQGPILWPLLFIIYITTLPPLFSHPHPLCWWHCSISRNLFSNFNVHCSIQHQSHSISMLLFTLYCSLVIPYFTYWSSIWYPPVSFANSENLQKPNTLLLICALMNETVITHLFSQL